MARTEPRLLGMKKAHLLAGLFSWYLQGSFYDERCTEDALLADAFDEIGSGRPLSDVERNALSSCRPLTVVQGGHRCPSGIQNLNQYLSTLMEVEADPSFPFGWDGSDGECLHPFS